MLIGIVMILGSVVGKILVVLSIIMIYVQAMLEEELLVKRLEGYQEYLKKVKKRIIPYIL